MIVDIFLPSSPTHAGYFGKLSGPRIEMISAVECPR